jgi:hypothetical protein
MNHASAASEALLVTETREPGRLDEASFFRRFAELFDTSLLSASDIYIEITEVVGTQRCTIS